MTTVLCAQAAKHAAPAFALSTSLERDRLLSLIAKQLTVDTDRILAANKTDMQNAADAGLSEAMQDRLLLNTERIAQIADSLLSLANVPDPLGIIESGSRRPNGLLICKQRVPIGLIAIIYESRPNVTVDAAALCLKAGNAVLLRGGKEAIETNRALIASIHAALEQAGFSPDIVGFVTDITRQSAADIMELVGVVDLLIPRGGKELITRALRESKVPVIETGAGNCHIYVDASADLEMALSVVENAKLSRPSVCNAVETLLVHRAAADAFLPMLSERIGAQVEFRCDDAARAILPFSKPASPEDWDTEYNDYILAAAIVDSVEQAVEHIDRHGTGHSEAILTTNTNSAQYFLDHVDASAVYLNASTRFTDGGEFGMSAEIGISTSKLHARGPMGLDALTTTKYIVLGNGQIR